MSSPVVTFLTDYGLSDPFVGVCHGVIAARCPQVRIIDLSHGVPPQDVRAGATALARALPFMPVGVMLAVVDPGVGGARRGVAIRAAAGHLLVGPDNGLLWPAALAAGGAEAAVDLAGSRFALDPVSATFHGRDVFAPVAAALAGGATIERAGSPIDPASLVALAPLEPQIEEGVLRAPVVRGRPLRQSRAGGRAHRPPRGGNRGRGHRPRRGGRRPAARPRGTDVLGGRRRRAAALRGLEPGAVAGGLVRLGGAATRGRRRGRAPDHRAVSSDAAGLGVPRLHLRQVDSTNVRARALAAGGAPHGTLVTAGEQTAGRGRQGRSWSAPAGSALLASFVVREPPRLLSLAAGTAVAAAAERLDSIGRPAAVKWPNDVLLDGRKVAGILVEGRPQERWAVLGIGLNVAVDLHALGARGSARARRPSG